MTTIDITSELSRFERHLENNPRTIFSAKFGDGKTYFLNEYMRQHKMDTLFVVLHPINYSVATNEDIFEYVKRDILVELSKEHDFKEVDWKAVAKDFFSVNTFLEVSQQAADGLTPDCIIKPTVKALLASGSVFEKIKDKYAIESYFEHFSKMRGGIYEQDSFTVAIKAAVAKIQEHERKCVLLIEDLDRIDPGHLFRILNVLGAHIDEEKDTNKFGFDNIVAVLDYKTTKHVFDHFYGENADYSGYMAKFCCHNIFEYSIKMEACRQLREVLRNECKIEDMDFNHYQWYQDEKFTEQRAIKDQIERLSVRDIAHILDDLDGQYYQNEMLIGNHKIRLRDIPLLKMLAIFVRMNFKFTTDNLYQYLVRSKKSFSLLGNFVCARQEFNHAKVTYGNNEEQVIRFEEQPGGCLKAVYDYGQFTRLLEGAELRESMNKLLQMLCQCVHDCKPLA